MSPLAEIVERLLWESESSSLDFKETQYSFVGADDDAKSEIVKDIVAFANAFRREDAFILLGVRESHGGRAEVIGISEHLADADLQQLVSSKTNRPVEFSYAGVTVDGKAVGVIRIPCQNRPIYLTKRYGRLAAEAVYLRRGSSTAPATPDEIKRMGAEDVERSRFDGPELLAVQLLLRQAHFADRIHQLIWDISRIPHHYITAIARPAEYEVASRALWNRFNEEYSAFRRDMTTARDVLIETRARAIPAEQEALTSLLEAITEVRQSVESFVSTAHETFCYAA